MATTERIKARLEELLDKFREACIQVGLLTAASREPGIADALYWGLLARRDERAEECGRLRHRIARLFDDATGPDDAELVEAALYAAVGDTFSSEVLTALHDDDGCPTDCARCAEKATAFPVIGG
jgi:hypothetical protein